MTRKRAELGGLRSEVKLEPENSATGRSTFKIPLSTCFLGVAGLALSSLSVFERSWSNWPWSFCSIDVGGFACRPGIFSLACRHLLGHERESEGKPMSKESSSSIFSISPPVSLKNCVAILPSRAKTCALPRSERPRESCGEHMLSCDGEVSL